MEQWQPNKVAPAGFKLESSGARARTLTERPPPWSKEYNLIVVFNCPKSSRRGVRQTSL